MADAFTITSVGNAANINVSGYSFGKGISYHLALLPWLYWKNVTSSGQSQLDTKIGESIANPLLVRIFN